MAHSRVINWARPFEEEQAEDEEWDELMANHDPDLLRVARSLSRDSLDIRC